MKNILLISATARSNFKLAQDIAAQAPSEVKTSIVVLEELDVPLYCPQAEAQGVPAPIVELTNQLAASDAFVLLAPEYNGSIPPVVTNAIAWISRASKDWRASFSGKFAAVGTMSGGGGQKVVQAMRTQLEHLGTTVHSHSLVCSGQKPLNPESAKKVMADLAHWVR